MPTVRENLALVRVLLDEPSPQQPSDRILFELFSNQVQHHQTQLQNSSAQWSVADWPLNVSSAKEDYLITAADFGKPFMVYTENATDLYQPRIEIPFAMMQNADQFYSGPRQVYASSDNNFTASIISFYRKESGWYARVTPVPGGSATYRVWYETLPGAPQSLSDTPGLTPFHHLIRAQTALAALPYCAWGSVRLEDKADLWTVKTKALAMALGAQVTTFQAQFSTYIGTLMQAGIEAREGFGDAYLDSWSSGVGILGPNQF